MIMIEKPRPVELSDVVKGGKELLERLEPNEQNYAQRLFEARISFKGGDQIAWERFVKDNNSHVMAERLRKKREGREVMELIYKAVPITDGKTLIVESALAVHGEVSKGEVDNQEGVLEQIEI